MIAHTNVANVFCEGQHLGLRLLCPKGGLTYAVPWLPKHMRFKPRPTIQKDYCSLPSMLFLQTVEGVLSMSDDDQ